MCFAPGRIGRGDVIEKRQGPPFMFFGGMSGRPEAPPLGFTRKSCDYPGVRADDYGPANSLLDASREREIVKKICIHNEMHRIGHFNGSTPCSDIFHQIVVSK